MELKLCFCLQNNLPFVPKLRQINPDRTLSSHCFKIDFNIILKSKFYIQASLGP